MPDTLPGRWLSLLLLAPILAMGNALLFPRTPVVPPLPPPPTTQGGSWDLIADQPARRNRDLALSPSRTYGLQGAALSQLPVAGLKLNLTSMAVRNAPNFQVAFLSGTIPALRLQDRKILPIAGEGQLAMGRIGKSPAWQTCLLPSGQPGVTRAVLRRGLHSGQQPAPKWTLLLGLRDHPAHACLLVTITADGPATPAVIASVQPLVESVIAVLGSTR